MKWYRKAAEQGFTQAQFNLGMMYANGRGLQTDLVRAYMWLSLAASKNSGNAEYRDRVAELMTTVQIAEAQSLAREWRAKSEISGRVAQYPEPAAQGNSRKTNEFHTTREPVLTSRQTVRLIQERLAELGYNPGPADGIAGRKTQTAIERFQADFQLPVTGKASDELAGALQVAIAAKQRGSSPDQELSKPAGVDTASIEKEPEPGIRATGTGFAVTTDGRAVTNHHVVKGCAEMRSRPVGTLKILAVDARNDLALLQMEGRETKAANFRQGRGVRPGDDVVVAGFPLHGLLASDLNITTGNVSALAGPGDDRRYLQITAPVQPGNSGGPLLDLSGNVVGVVVGKLDALLIAGITGDIPQNVNFAISAGTVRAFLDAHDVPYELAPSEARRTAR